MANTWSTVRERVADRTDRVLARLREEWDTTRERESFAYGPRHFDPDQPPETVEGQLERIAGIASVVVFYAPAHEEAVLVYNPSGRWEPPGGVIEADQTPEEAARAEALEETGLAVELADLQYAGRFEFQWASGASVPLPVAQFVGHRIDGSLEIEREGRDHPGLTRATGVFTVDVLPENCRDRDDVLALLEEDNDGGEA